MPVQVNCPNPECGRRSRVADDLTGRPVRCRACGQTFVAGASTTADAAKPSSPPHASPPGTVHAQQIGRFRIQERLGAGAFGTVYRAYDPQLDREVALKVPNPGVLNSPSRVERFLREAKASAGLRHPNIVPLYDAGKDGDTYYIASAFIEGKPLSDEIPETGMPFARAAGLVFELAGAVGYAHEQGVVHRDIKPANVMVDRAGRPHLMDFGLASRTDEAEKLTHDGAVMGTPAYMAPEQAAGKSSEAGPPADQYALGVVLYELLTGTVPFVGPVPVVLHNVINAEPESPRQVHPNLPKDLETICLKAMAKQPADRYTDCKALAEDLRRWLTGDTITARRLPVTERAWRWVNRNKVVTSSAAAIVLALSAGLATSAHFAVRAEDARGRATLERDDADRARAAALASAKDANSQRAAAAQSAAELIASLGEKTAALTDKDAALTDKDAALTDAKAARQTAEQKTAEADAERKKAVEALGRKAVEEERANWNLYLARMQLARGAWREGRTHEVGHLLAATTPTAGERDYRGIEWHHLRAISGGQQTAFTIPKAELRRDVLGFSRDGKWLVTDDWERGQFAPFQRRNFEVWDTATGKAVVLPMKLFPSPEYLRSAHAQRKVATDEMNRGVQSSVFFSFHPREPKLAIFHNSFPGRPFQFAVVRLTDGKLSHSGVFGERAAARIPCYVPLPQYSADGSRFLYGAQNFDTQTGILIPTPGAPNPEQAFTPPEVVIPATHKPSVVSRMPDGTTPPALTKRIAELNALAKPEAWLQDSDARYFGVRRGTAGLLEINDLFTLQPAMTLPGVPDASHFTFSPDQKVLAIWSPDATVVTLYDVNKKAVLQTLRGNPSPVRSVGFADKGKSLLVACADGAVSKCAVDPVVTATRTEYARQDPYPGKGIDLTHADFKSLTDRHTAMMRAAPIGRLPEGAVSGRYDEPCWSLHTDPAGEVVAVQVVRAAGVAISPAGNGITLSNEKVPSSSVWLSELATGKALAQYRGVKLPPAARAAAFGLGGQFAVLDGGTLTAWDADRGEKVFQLADCERVVGVRYSPDGKTLLLDEYAPRGAVVYDATKGTKLPAQGKLAVPAEGVPRDIRRLFAFDPTGRPTGGKVLPDPRASSPPRSDPAARPVLSGAITAVVGSDCVAVSADGLRLACATARDGVTIFEGATLQEVWALKPPFPLTALEFTRDGTQLVGCDETGRLVVWGGPPKK